jgi:uncharacterized membrane protein YgcG
MGHSGRMRTSTGLSATTVWVAGATLATAGVTIALSVLGNQLLGSSAPVLSAAQVRAQLAAQGPPGPAVAAGPDRRPAVPLGAWTARNFSAGTVFAACAHDQATLTDWIPAQGFRTAGFTAGPAAAASVRFESASAGLVVTVTCRRGRPAFLSSAVAPHASATPTTGNARAGNAGAGTAPPAASPPPAAPADPGQGGKGGGGKGGGQGGPGGGGSGGGGHGGGGADG